MASLLESTFVFLDRVTESTEQKLWTQGIKTWDDFLLTDHIQGISRQRKIHYNSRIRTAKTALRNEDWKFFTLNLLPKYH